MRLDRYLLVIEIRIKSTRTSYKLRCLEVSEYRNGIQVGEQDSLIHKIGFNYTRSRHPLLVTTETEEVGTGGGRMYGSTCPEPTACAASIETSLLPMG